MDMAVSIFDPLYTSYLEDLAEDHIDDIIDFQLKVVDCMLHVCDRRAFNDENETDCPDKGNEKENNDASTRHKSPYDSLESFTYSDWKKHGKLIQSIWESCTEKSNLEKNYHTLMVKIQMFMILKWMNEKKEIESRVEFPSDNVECNIDSILSENLPSSEYIEIARANLTINGIRNDANDPLFGIFLSLLERRPIIIDHIRISRNYFQDDISLVTFQSELQKFLIGCYKIKIPGTSKLMLVYNSNNNHDTEETINQTHRKNIEKGKLGLDHEKAKDVRLPEKNNEWSEEEEIKKKRKERRKEKQQQDPVKDSKKGPEREYLTNESQYFNNGDDIHDEFVSTKSSLESKSTIFQDTTSVEPTKNHNTNMLEKNSSKACIRGMNINPSFISSKKAGRNQSKHAATEESNKRTKSPAKIQVGVSSKRLKRQIDLNSCSTGPKREIFKNTSQNLHDWRRVKKKFTVEEVSAIKNGVRKYGAGRWKEIKYEYEKILRHRTTVNIKDCYRNMLRRGDIEES